MGRAGTVTPGPTDGDARVVKVVDIVVFDNVVWGMSDPHTDRGRVHPPTVGNQTLPHRVMRRDLLRIVLRDPAVQRPRTRVADLHATRRHVYHLALLDAVVATARAKSHGIAAHVPYGAAVNQQVAATNDRDRTVEVHLRLPAGLARQRHNPVGMGEGQAAKLNVLDPAAGLQVALDHQQSLQPRGDDHRRLGPFARYRYIGQLTRWAGRGTIGPVRPRLRAHCQPEIAHPWGTSRDRPLSRQPWQR